MENSESCIFCEKPVIIHNPTYADKFKKKGSSLPTVSTVDEDLKIGSQTKPKKYLECNECQIDYIPTEIDLELLLSNLNVKANVGMRLDYFYPKISLPELILNHRTGIAKKPEHWASFAVGTKYPKILFYTGTKLDERKPRLYKTFLIPKDIYRVA